MDFEVLNKGGTDLNELSPTVIKVIGCGGGGSNAVNRMIEANIQNVDFVALNTDLQALNKSLAPNRIAIGQKLTQGLGAGGDPTIGGKAAEEDKDAIENILKGANMVFITAGMGGGTGTGSAPIVANIARQMGILTVGIVTTPFEWEGPQRMKLAQEGIQTLKDCADSVIVIPNAKIVDVYSKDLTFIEQMRAADDLLRQGIEGMSIIITKYGMPNIDFADVRAAMRGQGTALFGIGISSGENRAVDAATKAIHNPLLEDTSIDGARHFLVNVCTGTSFSGKELEEISKIVSAGASPGYDLKPGVVIDENMGDEISVTVIATGFGDKKDEKAEEEAKKVEEKAQEDEDVPSDEVSEKDFANLMSGVPLQSGFSVSGQKSANPQSAQTPSSQYSLEKKLDPNNPETPAVFRSKNLSRTINFKRK